jgi:dihydrodipicolinate synthase/N-acetylneuraminate lyase
VYGYTIAERTRNELDPGLLGALIADGLAGLKDSTKSIERHREYAAARDAGPRFDLFMGSTSLVLEAVRAGAAGGRVAVANSHPELCADLMRACREGSEDDAERLQADLAAVEEEVGRDGTHLWAEALRRGSPARARRRLLRRGAPRPARDPRAADGAQSSRDPAAGRRGRARRACPG